MKAHPTAIIDPKAQIAEDVEIGPYTIIEGDVQIDSGCWIGPHANILDGARIGKKCKIFAGAQIASIPQDLKFAGEVTTVEIGDGTQVREFVTISRGTADRDKTVVGKNCLLMAYSHVAHDCLVADYCIIGNATQMAGHIVMDSFAIVSGGAVIHQFCHIGTHVIIGGGSKVGKDVPPFVRAAREPLMFTGINTVGLKRRQFSNDKINEIQEIYRYIYQSGMNNTIALKKIREEITQSEERDLILDFIESSERGILRGP